MVYEKVDANISVGSKRIDFLSMSVSRGKLLIATYVYLYLRSEKIIS